MMKKITLIFFALFSAISFAQTSDLYFSMYGEGSSGNNKFLEIYNGTGQDVDLTTYSVLTYANGAATPNHELYFDAGTTLPAGEVFVIVHPQADATLMSIATAADNHIVHNATSFNGDDAVALYDGGVLLDLIGNIGVDPGSGWDVGSTTGATANHILIRKDNVCSPNDDPEGSFGTDDNTSEWIVIPDAPEEWDAIGSHSHDAAACQTTSVGETNAEPFVMFPNPASNGEVNIKTVNDAKANIVVFDILGKRIASESLEGNQLNISGLRSGIYLVQVTQNGATITKKLIVE